MLLYIANAVALRKLFSSEDTDGILAPTALPVALSHHKSEQQNCSTTSQSMHACYSHGSSTEQLACNGSNPVGPRAVYPVLYLRADGTHRFLMTCYLRTEEGKMEQQPLKTKLGDIDT